MHQEGLTFANSQPCNSSVFKIKLTVHLLFLHAKLETWVSSTQTLSEIGDMVKLYWFRWLIYHLARFGLVSNLLDLHRCKTLFHGRKVASTFSIYLERPSGTVKMIIFVGGGIYAGQLAAWWSLSKLDDCWSVVPKLPEQEFGLGIHKCSHRTCMHNMISMQKSRLPSLNVFVQFAKRIPVTSFSATTGQNHMIIANGIFVIKARILSIIHTIILPIFTQNQTYCRG